MLNNLKALTVVLLAGIAASAFAVDTSAPEFEDLRENYARIAETYPEVRRTQFDRMLNQYLDEARERYRLDQEASDLAGMGIARQAMRLLEGAIAANAEEGDFAIVGNVREELEEYVQQIKSDRQRIIDLVKQRHDTLRRRTLARFATLARGQDPDLEDQDIMETFEEWLGESLSKDTSAEDPGEQIEEERPRISASQLGIDLYSQEMRSLREGFNQNYERLGEGRRQVLRRFLEQEIAAARSWYAEQRRIRNVRGMAVSGNAVNMLEDALKSLNESGAFEFPEPDDVRDELKGFLEELDDKMREALNIVAEREKNLEQQGFVRFKALMSEQVDGVSEEDLQIIFTDWIKGLYAEEQQAPDQPGGPAQPATAADRLYFAQQGDAQEWFTVGSWVVESKGVDIFQVPIYAGEDAQGRKVNMMTQAHADWKYSHETDILREHFYAYRLRALPDMKPIEVVSWPSQRNDWSVEVRTSNEQVQHGFVLQAGRTTGPGGRLVAERRTSVAVTTEPAGARVYVDGRRYYAPGTDSVTPMNISLGEGRYEIRLERADHLTETIANVRAREGLRIDHRFRHESELPGTNITFASGSTWHRTNVQVDEGDKIWVVVKGDWTCGFRGEAVGPGGYPRGDFPHYYQGEELRKFTGANYGALLLKIGERYTGAPSSVENQRAKPVGRLTGIRADTWGNIWFDINEKEGQEQRRPNRGALNIKIVVLPGGRVPER